MLRTPAIQIKDSNCSLKKMEEQSRMDNPKPLATFGTQDTGRRQTKHKKQQQTKMSVLDCLFLIALPFSLSFIQENRITIRFLLLVGFSNISISVPTHRLLKG
jgi:hypothetical protein